MGDIVNTKDIFNSISINFCGVELNKIKELKEYGEYVCDLLDAGEKHTTALLLHTGSIYYQVIAVTIAAIHCLFYSNTDVEELLSSLSGGEMLLFDGERVQFVGFIEGASLGSCYKSGVTYCVNNAGKGRIATPVYVAKNHNISLYRGDSDSLGARGIKNTLKERADFLEIFGNRQKGKKVSTKINYSFAVIADRELAEDVYRNTILTYNGKKYELAKIVTATYFSDNESYQLGSNPAKEEPIIRFYSKISACRDDIYEDKDKRILGCIACNENIWLGSSEIHDLADRRSLKYMLLLARTHYTDYSEWIGDEKYKLYAIVPQVCDKQFTSCKTYNRNLIEFNKEVRAFANRKIETIFIDGGGNPSKILEIKNCLLKIKRDTLDGEEKEQFLMASYLLLNLCRSAFFPLSYCDKAFELKLLQWNIAEKLNDVKSFADRQTGEVKVAAEFIYKNIAGLIDALYNSNPKGEYIKRQIINRKRCCVVSPKAYYATLFLKWLEGCNVTGKNFIDIVTPSSLGKSDGYEDNVIFSTVYLNRDYNEFAEFSYISAKVLCYPEERHQADVLDKAAKNGVRLIHDHNYFEYELNLTEEREPVEEISSDMHIEDDFESEMDKLAKDLQLRGANSYLRTSKASGDGTSRIEKILAFGSGAVGFFTKYYKGYRINGEKIDEVALDDLKVGDSIIFTKETENKDIVDALLRQLLENQYKNTPYPQYYKWSVAWKEGLRQFMKEHGVSFKEITNMLALLGCDRRETTIRAWLYEETHIVGPRDLDSFVVIANIVKNHKAEEYKKGCDEIRSLRTRILRLLGKAIIKNINSDTTDELWDAILTKAENLSQIEQITGISNVEEGTRMPLYLINKPVNI